MIVNSKIILDSSSVISHVTEERLAVKAANSLPEFYKEEFPTFQEFIDVYYQYMSKKTVGFKSMSTIKDIDEIGKKYLTEFYKMYAKDVPVFPYIGMADFIRNSRAFYTSRGSEDSFRFLFRIMFGQEIDIKYPKENMFAGSTGKWKQKISIYVHVDQGSLGPSIIGRKLLIRALDGSTSSFTVKALEEISPDVFEIEVENFIKQNVIYDAKVFAFYNSQANSYDMRGTVKRGINKFVVVNPGTGFLPGQVYSVNSAEGEITFRVTSIDDNGGIKRIEFIKFAGVSETEFTESIRDASISFKLDTINTYTGYYENTDGFLSNQSKLQDSFYYQIFSYVIKSRVSRELYIDVMDKILHPSGLISFSEYETGSGYDIPIGIETDVQYALDVVDVINTYDDFLRKFKAFRDFSDAVVISDTLKLTLHKFFSDQIELEDSGEVILWKAGQYVDEGYFEDELYTTSLKTGSTWDSRDYFEEGYTTPDNYIEQGNTGLI